MVEGELRSSQYDRTVTVVGGGEVVVPTRTWEIRARAGKLPSCASDFGLTMRGDNHGSSNS